MARRKRARRRYAAIGAEKETHALRDAIHHAGLVHEEAGRQCPDALEDLLTAKGALEEGLAYASGVNGGRLGATARRAVRSAAHRFTTRCLCGS